MIRTILAATLASGAVFALSALGTRRRSQPRPQSRCRLRQLPRDKRSEPAGDASLAGQQRTHLVQQMQDFKTGKRPATIMHQIAKGYTDEQIEALAAYFSRKRRDRRRP